MFNNNIYQKVTFTLRIGFREEKKIHRRLCQLGTRCTFQRENAFFDPVDIVDNVACRLSIFHRADGDEVDIIAKISWASIFTCC